MLRCPVLTFLPNFEKGAVVHFHLALGPADYTAGPDEEPRLIWGPSEPAIGSPGLNIPAALDFTGFTPGFGP